MLLSTLVLIVVLYHIDRTPKVLADDYREEVAEPPQSTF
jgi:hypothetical protein